MMAEARQLTEAEFSNLLETDDTDTLVGKVFDYYPVGCIHLGKIEYDKLDELCERLKSGEGDRKETIRAVISIVRCASIGTPDPCPIVESIKSEIASDLSSDITAAELAEKAGISLYYMLHIFKKEVGRTITEYRNMCRLEKAKDELVNSDKNATSIALECGFANSSYFAEIFKQSTKVTPLEYRKIMKETKRTNKVLEKANDADLILWNMLEHKDILEDGFDVDSIAPSENVKTYAVTYPTEEYSFLHEAAIIEYEGVLFAAWYNCPKRELADSSPIRFSKSYDCGKTWTDPKIVVDDPTGAILYCPPVFGVQDGKLYMFINQMTKPDCIHSLDLYVYNKERDNFDELWSRGDIPVKLNTNVYTLSNGKLLLPGRWCVRDTFSNTPCVIISDSGRIDADWRIVKIQEDCKLPDGSTYDHPEMSAIVDGEKVYIFCRNDQRKIPLLYISEDNGETWSKPIAHDLPFCNSKIYSDRLSDGRSYVVGNIYSRSLLAVFFSEKDNPMKFVKGIVLRDAKNKELDICSYWCYPVAYEYDGKLYVIYSFDIGNFRRGAALSVVDLSKI